MEETACLVLVSLTSLRLPQRPGEVNPEERLLWEKVFLNYTDPRPPGSVVDSAEHCV